MLCWHVDWHDTFGEGKAMHNYLESAALAWAQMPVAAIKQARMTTRPDLQSTNLQKQGHGQKAPINHGWA